MIPELLPGDIILSRSKGIISGTIRFFEKMQTGEARVSHCAMALGDDLVIEALWRVRINKLKKYENQPIIVYRLHGYSMDVRESVAKHAMLVAGNGYPIWRLFLHALDATTSFIRRKPTFWFTAPVGIPSYHSCIQLAAHMWAKYGGYHWSVDWAHITPDLADDELSKTAEVIYSSL